MNREIKFRIWSKKDKCFLDAETHFSNEISFTPDEWSRGNFVNAQFEIDEESKKDFELMQYTGLKDKNGKEIYEGDVVKTLKYPDEFFVVEWNERFLGWYIESKTSEPWREFLSPVLGNHVEVEVIGNIYENPELLELPNKP